MHHLTINTGDLFQVPDGKVAPHAIRALQPMVAKGGDVIPGMAGWSSVLVMQDGCAVFDVRHRGIIVTVNTMAWSPTGRNNAWCAMESAYRAAMNLGDVPLAELNLPPEPESLPWLATLIAPAAAGVMRPVEGLWLADFEQCFAEAILSRARHLNANN